MIKVLKPGFYSVIQDLGRTGFQEYGVPYSGVMDSYAASVANMMLGNKAHDALLEMTMTGATLQFSCKTWICLSGAEISPKLNDLSIENNKVIQINEDDVLSFGKLNFGFRCYLAVSGGFKTEKIMESRSMYHGVTKRVFLVKNDEFLINENVQVSLNKNAAIKLNYKYLYSEIIEVYKGPEFDKLSQEQQDQLLFQDFHISKENNRMGCQLKQVLENSLDPIITSAVLPGTVQLTPSGKLIILMRDCQTTGGYPRILQLKEMSINVLAQKFTGEIIKFRILNKSLR